MQSSSLAADQADTIASSPVGSAPQEVIELQEFLAMSSLLPKVSFSLLIILF